MYYMNKYKDFGVEEQFDLIDCNDECSKLNLDGQFLKENVNE